MCATQDEDWASRPAYTVGEASRIREVPMVPFRGDQDFKALIDRCEQLAYELSGPRPPSVTETRELFTQLPESLYECEDLLKTYLRRYEKGPSEG